ncbi:hypothetical protein SAMN04487983_10676 [Streptomyces sp. yr375]|nr:hypothetical protein SAMN04487983_10676 [Streptomyces sp. yr375]
MILVIVVAVLTLLVGLAANRFLRPRLLSEDDDTGMAVKDLVGRPLRTLTVRLLAFVLVTANGSYGKAEVSSRGEARATSRWCADWPTIRGAGPRPGERRRRPRPPSRTPTQRARVRTTPTRGDLPGRI